MFLNQRRHQQRHKEDSENRQGVGQIHAPTPNIAGEAYGSRRFSLHPVILVVPIMTLSRRHFFFGSFALSAFAAKPAGDQPSIVLIIPDGIGSWMLGCYGNKEIHTPHIDELA